jgi:hypothetical protein
MRRIFEADEVQEVLLLFVHDQSASVFGCCPWVRFFNGWNGVGAEYARAGRGEGDR